MGGNSKTKVVVHTDVDTDTDGICVLIATNTESFPDRLAPTAGLLHSCMLSLVRRSSRWSRSHSTLPNNARSDPRWLGWQVVIGIEVHAQVKSRKKLFSGERRTAGYAVDSRFRPGCSRFLDE